MKNSLLLSCLLALLPAFANASYSQSEIDCLTKNIYYEAGAEPIAGQIAVAQVTINRTGDKRFPNTICGVVHQKTRSICQFSWTCKRPKTPIDPSRYSEIKELAVQVMNNEQFIPALQDSLYFHSKRVNPQWRLKRVKTIGGHVFYKDYK